MAVDLKLLVCSAVLTWVMLVVASALRLRSWTPAGMHAGLGNRDRAPEPSVIAGRADRAAKNMLENLPLFAILILTAHVAGVAADKLELPAWLFFAGRLAYFPIYVTGIPYARTAAWGMSIVALGMLVCATLGA